ncbi:MAG: hypothetical protein ACXIUW_12205 [Roseinatronobacter sp.]
MTQTPDLEPLFSMLDAEREALLSGAYDQLEPIAKAKADFLSVLEGQDSAPPFLEKLGLRLEQNSVLLKSALDGLKEGRSIVLGMAASQTLTVYGSDGAQKALRRRDTTFERKL